MLIAQNFEKLLTDFFSLYHPRQVKKVGELVAEFKGQEIEVLKAICAKYKKDYSVIPGLVEATNAPAPTPVIEEKAEESVAELEVAPEESVEELKEAFTEEEEVVEEESTEEEEEGEEKIEG